MFPPIEPFRTGHLRVEDGSTIYWEASGNPAGKPGLFLHGGPGAGVMGRYRGHFDPDRYLIVSLDQRGCGRSRPRVNGPGADLAGNTTQTIISDLEELREHLEIAAWLVVGVSWGTTLGLAYAQAHPERVTELVLAAVTTTTKQEVDWIVEDMRRIFPEKWEAFEKAADRKPNQRLIDAWYERITHPERGVREQAALDWCLWEDVHVSLGTASGPNPLYDDPEFRMVFATLVIHYWRHAAFLDEPGSEENMKRIAHIPGVLIHGRRDISSPLQTAWDLHKRWPASEFIVIEEEGHGGSMMAEAVNKAVARFGKSPAS
ncbi:MAG TPA: prolyl aminopeptidase [Verrucomicrobiales bacterium]|nr:prolyl aminopeptidase [Verrucomicrobiales bacterium]